MIGIIGAMQMEVEHLKKELQDSHVRTIASIAFHQGTLNGIPCVVAQCSPGKVNAAVCAQIMILSYHTDLIINTGVAGGIGAGIEIGDLVIATAVVEHDMDTTSLGDAMGLISGLNQVEIATDPALTEKIAEEAASCYGAPVHKGIIATGDQFISANTKLEWIAKTFHAICCEMEGGSIGHVCAMNHIPFAVIRAISDNGNDNATVDFAQFAVSAAEKGAKFLYHLMPKLIF